VKSNQMVSQCINELMDTVIKLEKVTNIPQKLDALEGRRFLLRMLSASVDAFVEHIDTDRPQFRHSESPHRKMFGDCPDADYLQAPIDLRDGRTYQLIGKIPKGTNYIGVMLYGKAGRIGVCKTDEQLNVDSDGNFKILISANSEDKPDLLGQGDEHLVMVRQYFTDRSIQPSISLAIDFLGNINSPKPLEINWLAKRINLSRRMLESIFHRTLDAYGRISSFPKNQFVSVPVELLFPTPDNTYRICWYELGENEKMVIKGKLPSARYFSFTFYNVWLESYDYTKHQVILNHDQIELDQDGNFILCASAKNGGYTNWIDTAGHNSGYLVARSLLLKGEHPQFDVSIQKTD